MFALSFYPKVFKEVLSNIPTVAFKTVDWKTFTTRSKIVLKNYLAKKSHPKAHEFLNNNFNITTHSVDGNRSGEDVLDLYFTQIYNPYGLFLDLRGHHFGVFEDQTCFRPSALFYKFDEDFRIGLVSLYESFYSNDNKKFIESLDHLGLTKGLEDQHKEELAHLFYSHFGESQDRVEFNVESFNQSFFKIFDFFMRHKIKLSTDFIFLGFYLVTLYMNLESLGETLNVKECFNNVRNKSNIGLV